MAHHIFEVLRNALVHYGYWAIAGVLVLENAGLPVPGETVLLLASFLAYSEHQLQLSWIIVVATLATTASGEIGFALGRYGGRPLIERYARIFRVDPANLARGERLFGRYGAATIFFARFIFGLRVLAALLAGALRMPWQKFVFFNFLGATVWVTVISSAGYFFGGHWNQLVHDMKRFDLAVGTATVLMLLFLWWRSRRSPQDR
jgi:membrane protein DedA with SNARE-associated domain